jgi:predicted membrane protein
MLKKFAILIPVLILALFYFKARYHEEYAVAGLRGKASLALGVLIMFIIMLIGVYSRKQETIV